MINKVSSRFFYKKIKTYIFIPALYDRKLSRVTPKVLRDYFFRIQYTVYSFFRELIIGSCSFFRELIIGS